MILSAGYQWVNGDQPGPKPGNLLTALFVMTQALKQLVPAVGEISANEKRK